MIISPEPMSAPDIYKLMTGIVVPRPIAWITTLSADGVLNLAPFSCFTFVSSKPPMVGFNCGLRNGQRKDTSINIEATGDFVVNIGDDSMIEQVHRSALDFPPDISEVAELGLDSLPSQRVKTPRLSHAPISMECRFSQKIEFGETGAEFIVGEVLLFHIRDGLCNNNKIDTATLRPICRIGGPNYATLSDIISMQHVGDVRTGPS
ncbi:flavin reductase family protein [Ferrovibrio sp.]|uniref:flavin reductase family protein n=1 Tax=Ferrovibrio sp. TaxID=1917215 RepID=UPI0025BDD5A5|nr:flavin reductase family protein [Ferrovibrio sp.]MBX3456715.1 flavin reductase family protein [Ferrovibrio sp.]